MITTESMDQMQLDEQYILANRSEPDSLYDVSRTQNVTNISDELFNSLFACLKLPYQTKPLKNLTNMGKFYIKNSKLLQEISSNQELLQSFSSVIQTQCMDNISCTDFRMLENIIKKNSEIISVDHHCTVSKRLA